MFVIANATSIYLWDESLNAFCPQAISGFDNEQRTRLQEWDVVSGTVSAFDQLMQNQTPVIMNNQSISDELANLIFPNYDLSSNLLIIFPITLAGNTIGAFLTDFSGTKLETEASQKSWDDMYTIVQGVAQQAGLAYENIERVTSKEEEAYISVALLQVAQAIVSLNQLDEILEFIVRITPILVGVKRCIIFTWDHIARVFKLARYYGFSKAEIEFARQEIEMDDFPFISTVLNQNQITYDHLDQNDSPLNWMDISPSEINTIQGISMEVNGDAIEHLNIETLREKGRLLLGFPLSVKGDVLGVMVIEEEEISKGLPSYHIREKRIEIVNGITQLAAVAMKNELLQQEALNSEKLERELQLAREIQQAFLPHSLPTFPGWDIDVHWEPARQVGGDFYDIILIEKNKIGFVIADVADKGMPAALFMTLIRTLIRAAAKDTLSPSSVLRQVNDLLLQDSKNSMFVTVFYGVIDLLSGDLVYSNAGHNPPIVKSIESGEFIELTRTSMALGIFEDITVEEREFSLKSGDWVFFYTDGVTEAFSLSEEMFGIQRLNELLKERIFSSSKELVNAVKEDVLDFIKDAELSDDLTLAAIFKS
jgi:serine phosphatase RsbU (regulator of sigma subunit)